MSMYVLCDAWCVVRDACCVCARVCVCLGMRMCVCLCKCACGHIDVLQMEQSPQKGIHVVANWPFPAHYTVSAVPLLTTTLRAWLLLYSFPPFPIWKKKNEMIVTTVPVIYTVPGGGSINSSSRLPVLIATTAAVKNTTPLRASLFSGEKDGIRKK